MTEQRADAIMAIITVVMILLILIFGDHFITLIVAGGGIALGYAYFYQALGVKKHRNLAIFWGIILIIYVLAVLLMT